MIDYILVYPNGGSGGGGSMDVSIPSGTLYDTSWTDGYKEWGSDSSGGTSGFGDNNRYTNGESGIYNIPSGKNNDFISTSLVTNSDTTMASHDDELSVDYGEQFSTLDYGLRGKVPLAAGFSLTLSQSVNSDYPVLGLSWRLLSVNPTGVAVTIPGLGGNLILGFQYKGLLIVGFSFGPAFVRSSFDFKKVMDGLEEWHREATSRIYNQYNVGGSGFNMSQLP